MPCRISPRIRFLKGKKKQIFSSSRVMEARKMKDCREFSIREWKPALNGRGCVHQPAWLDLFFVFGPSCLPASSSFFAAALDLLRDSGPFLPGQITYLKYVYT